MIFERLHSAHTAKITAEAHVMSQKSGRPFWLRSMSCSRDSFIEERGYSADGQTLMDDHSTLAIPGLGAGSWKLGLSLHQAVSALRRRMGHGERVSMQVKGEHCAVWLLLPGNIRLEFDAASQLLQRITAVWPWPKGGLFIQLPPRPVKGRGQGEMSPVFMPVRLCGPSEPLKVQDVLNFKFPALANSLKTAEHLFTKSELDAQELSFQGLSFTPSSEDPSVCQSVSITCLDTDNDPGSAVHPLCGARGTAPVCISNASENGRCIGVQVEMMCASSRSDVSSQGETTSGPSPASSSSGMHGSVARSESVAVLFGEGMQAVISSLGHPDDVFYCNTTGDQLHSWHLKAKRAPRLSGRQTSQREGMSPSSSKKSGSRLPSLASASSPSILSDAKTTSSAFMTMPQRPKEQPVTSTGHLVCFNYFALGLDVVFDAKELTVQRLVLHTNSPRHASFGQYARCPFRLALACCCSYTQDRHASVKQLHRRTVVTPSTCWSHVAMANVCGCARLVRSISHVHVAVSFANVFHFNLGVAPIKS